MIMMTSASSLESQRDEARRDLYGPAERIGYTRAVLGIPGRRTPGTSGGGCPRLSNHCSRDRGRLT